MFLCSYILFRKMSMELNIWNNLEINGIAWLYLKLLISSCMRFSTPKCCRPPVQLYTLMCILSVVRDNEGTKIFWFHEGIWNEFSWKQKLIWISSQRRTSTSYLPLKKIPPIWFPSLNPCTTMHFVFSTFCCTKYLSISRRDQRLSFILVKFRNHS